MSKASKWTEDRSKPRPMWGSPDALKTIALVGVTGGLVITSKVNLTPMGALALACWIYDTFGEHDA